MTNTPAKGTLTSATSGDAYIPLVSERATNVGGFNIALWGTFVATVRLEKTVDGGANWLPITSQALVGSTPTVVQLYTWTAPGADQAQVDVAGTQYRLTCTSFTSGTINYYIG